MRWLLLVVALLATSCREGPGPFSPADPGESAGRLTFSPKGDHTPAWNRTSDSIYYTAESYPNLPSTSGLLLAISRMGGVVDPILDALQVGVARQPRLAAPALAPNGSRIAFFELTDVRDREFDFIECDTVARFVDDLPAYDTAGTNSILQEAVLRVRPINSRDPGDDARITVHFAGRTVTAPGVITNEAHPFQRLFEWEGVPIFRPGWSPDANRIVFSDGSRLHIWIVGQSTTTQLAGTDDGIMPAWSPDGSWIAFSRPFRGGTQTFGCRGWFNGANLPAALFSRTVYTPLTRDDAQLMLIRPDGTGLRNLGVGDSPAWTPDSKTVVAHREGRLFRIAIDTGDATAIPNTLNAYEPAISADGRALAFSRRTVPGLGEGFLVKGNYDIWVEPF